MVAAVVPKPGATIKPGEIIDYCKSRVSNWKCPKEVLFLDELPRNKMGKILKNEVVKRFLEPSPPRKEGP